MAKTCNNIDLYSLNDYYYIIKVMFLLNKMKYYDKKIIKIGGHYG